MKEGQGVYPWLSEAASTARQAGGVREDWRGWKGPDPQRNAGHVGEMILLPTSQAPLKDFKQRMTPSMTIFIAWSPVTPPPPSPGLAEGLPVWPCDLLWPVTRKQKFHVASGWMR